MGTIGEKLRHKIIEVVQQIRHQGKCNHMLDGASRAEPKSNNVKLLMIPEGEKTTSRRSFLVGKWAICTLLFCGLRA